MIFLDVSELPAPEPLAQIIDAIEKLESSELLCVTHRQQPCLLFNMLKEKGFDFSIQEKNNLVKIFIWHSEFQEGKTLTQGIK